MLGESQMLGESHGESRQWIRPSTVLWVELDPYYDMMQARRRLILSMIFEETPYPIGDLVEMIGGLIRYNPRIGYVCDHIRRSGSIYTSDEGNKYVEQVSSRDLYEPLPGQWRSVGFVYEWLRDADVHIYQGYNSYPVCYRSFPLHPMGFLREPEYFFRDLIRPTPIHIPDYIINIRPILKDPYKGRHSEQMKYDEAKHIKNQSHKRMRHKSHGSHMGSRSRR